jgi:hypothetical protein
MPTKRTSDPNLAEPSGHPDVAVVVIGRHDTERLPAALDALVGAARAFGVEVLAVATPSAGRPAGTGGMPLPVRLITADDDRPDAAWRARALAETAADVVEFVDARKAAGVPWDDVLPRRLGLVRVDREPLVDVRERLQRAGVVEPGP